LGFTNWLVILLHQLATIKFSGTIITEPSTSFLAPLPGISYINYIFPRQLGTIKQQANNLLLFHLCGLCFICVSL
jgi:hypothetical protein